MAIEITPRQALIALLCAVAFLLVANLTGIVARLNFGHAGGLVYWFDMNTEKNIPTLYSTLALLCASVLLLIISNVHRKAQEPHYLWAILAAIFLFLAFDEAFSIHERLGQPVRKALGATGLLYYAWIIPYGIAVIVLLLSYLKFLLALPKNIMVLFLVSGAIFVLGAVGFEMLGGWCYEKFGADGLLYALLYTCEELLEMLGVAVFIYALLTYILTQHPHLHISLINSTRAIQRY